MNDCFLSITILSYTETEQGPIPFFLPSFFTSFLPERGEGTIKLITCFVQNDLKAAPWEYKAYQGSIN